MKRTDNEKRKADNEKRKSEIANAKIAKRDNTAATPAEDIIPEESTLKDNAYHMKTRLKVLASKYGLSYTYNSVNIKTAIAEKFNQPTQVICFKFVRDSPWTEDLKMMIEDSFEEHTMY